MIPLRRTILAFAVTFVCALLVFTLPRFTWNSVQAAINPQQAAAPGAAAVSAPAPDTQAAVPPVAARSVGARLMGVFGLAAILAIGVGLSRNRRAISWRVVAWGLGLQVAFAIFVLRVPLGQRLFRALGDVVTRILSFSYAGSAFVFGEIGK